MSEFMVVATGGKIFKGAREIRKLRELGATSGRVWKEITRD